jgi:hypothetical protein
VHFAIFGKLGFEEMRAAAEKAVSDANSQTLNIGRVVPSD